MNWLEANAELPRPTTRVIFVSGICGVATGAKSTSEPTGIGPFRSRPAWYLVIPVVSALGSFDAQLSCDEDRNLSSCSSLRLSGALAPIAPVTITPRPSEKTAGADIERLIALSCERIGIWLVRISPAGRRLVGAAPTCGEKSRGYFFLKCT